MNINTIVKIIKKQQTDLRKYKFLEFMYISESQQYLSIHCYNKYFGRRFCYRFSEFDYFTSPDSFLTFLNKRISEMMSIYNY